VNRTGVPVSYRARPGSNCLPLARPEAKFLRRAAFLKHNLWVTPSTRTSSTLEGRFPNQNPRVGEGLANWVQKDRPLVDSDIVLWWGPLTIPLLTLPLSTPPPSPCHPGAAGTLASAPEHEVAAKY